MVELLAWSPARILGLEKQVGSLKTGAQADFVLFSPKEATIFEEGKLHSASRNSPFLGQKLPGSVHSTYVGGTLVHGRKKQK
jgi:dihydroorotase-like cyclic amidohydrolase